jgi:hypothetical protein
MCLDEIGFRKVDCGYGLMRGCRGGIVEISDVHGRVVVVNGEVQVCDLTC